MRTLAAEGDDKPKVQLQRARSWALLATGRVAEATAAIDDAERGGRCPLRAGVQ